MGIVEEEADEIIYWIELLVDSGLLEQSRIDELSAETNEIVAMVVSSIRTARVNGSRSRASKSAIRIPESAI